MMKEKLKYIKQLLDNHYKCTSYKIQPDDNIYLSVVTLIFTKSNAATKEVTIQRRELPCVNMLFEANNHPYIFLESPASKVIHM